MKNKIFLFLIIILAAGLRFNKITSLPALNADEAALGYNAYSLLKTGMDEHGASWPLVFKSFGDYKPGVYVYLAMPFVKLFGLNVLSVRMPGLILSIVSVWLVYLLVGVLFKKKSQDSSSSDLKVDCLALLSALMLAISPWHIHFSRGAWETQVSLTFLLLGVYGFLKGLKNSWWFLVWIISFVLSIYTYHSMRLIVPLIALGLVFIFWKNLGGEIRKIGLLKFIKKKKVLILSLVLGMVLMIPLAVSLTGESGLSRAEGVSIFADSGPAWRANEARGLHADFNNWKVKLLHNKPLYYGLRFYDNYLRHFSANFLFVNGDEIQRNKVFGFGQLYLVSVPFVFAGLLSLLRNLRKSSSKLILFWLLVAPIPAALTFQSPHALRSLNMVVPWAVITAMGIYDIAFNKKGVAFMKSLAIFITTILFVWDLGRYLFNYYRLTVPNYPFSSQYTFNNLVPWTESVKDNYDCVYVTDRYDQPYILFLFFSKYDPAKFQQEGLLTPRDKFGFSTVRNYSNYHFGSIEDFDKLKSECGHSLVIGTLDEIPDDQNVLRKFSYQGVVYFEAVNLN